MAKNSNGYSINRNLNNIGRPVSGYAPITLGFGEVYQGVSHKGIDFGVPVGTPVLAAADGVVLQSGWQEGGYGFYVILSHNDGSGSVYAHLRDMGLPAGSCVTKAGSRESISREAVERTG